MDIQIHSIHFDADVKLLDFVRKKIEKLQTFYDRMTDVEVFLRLEKGDKEHSARENKAVEIKINLPGTSLFAKSHEKTFEIACDEATENLRTQLTKHKEKQQEK